MNCVALQFQDVGSTTAATTIAKLTSTGLTAGVYDTMETDAPCIMFYNGLGYDYYYYISDAFDENENEVTAWADGEGTETDVTKMIGSGFWFKVPEDTCTTGSLVLSGEVNSNDSLTINIASGLTLACNPYPTSIDFSKVTTASLEPGSYDTMETDAPCIMFYNGLGYDYYYYISDAFDENENEVTAWADGEGTAVTDLIASPGEAFWARSNTAGTLTFVK